MVVFLVVFFSREGFHETANKSWTSWWTEIVFCLLDFSVCFPFLVHSVFITLYSVSFGLCSLHQLDGFRNCYTLFPSGNQWFMEVRIYLSALDTVSCRNWGSLGTPKSHGFTTGPVLGWGSYALFLTVFKHQIFWFLGRKSWDGTSLADSHSSLNFCGCIKLSAQEPSPHSHWTCNESHHTSDDRWLKVFERVKKVLEPAKGRRNR